MAKNSDADLSESHDNQPGQKLSIDDSVFIWKERHPWDNHIDHVIEIDSQNSQVVVQYKKNSDLNIYKKAFYYYEVMAADRECMTLAIKFLYMKTHVLLVYIHHGF